MPTFTASASGQLAALAGGAPIGSFPRGRGNFSMGLARVAGVVMIIYAVKDLIDALSGKETPWTRMQTPGPGILSSFVHAEAEVAPMHLRDP